LDNKVSDNKTQSTRSMKLLHTSAQGAILRKFFRTSKNESNTLL